MNLHIAPSVASEAERRCQAVRRGDLGPYGELVRANAQELVATMFPRFTRHRGAERLCQDIDAFYKCFGAARAEFIHLATEFVRFMQPRLPLGIGRPLIEYEWMLFDVEVDKTAVPIPMEGTRAARPTFASIPPCDGWPLRLTCTRTTDLRSKRCYTTTRLVPMPSFAHSTIGS